MSLRVKLFSGFLTLLILFIITSLFSLRGIQLLQQNVKKTQEHPLAVTKAGKRIEIIVMSMQNLMKNFVFVPDSDKRDDFIERIKDHEIEALKMFDIVQERIIGKEGKILALQNRNAFLHWNSLRQQIIRLVIAGNIQEAQQYTLNEDAEYVSDLMKELKRFTRYAANKAEIFNRESEVIASQTRMVTMVLFFVSVLLGSFIALYLSLSISRKLSAISRAATEMAEGKMYQLIEVKGSDELDQVVINFNKMAVKLNTMYETLDRQVIERTKELEKTNKELYELQKSLEQIINDRTKELESKVKKLNKSQKAMLYMVEDLNQVSRELKVQRLELEATNKELEAFAYSVSHDLRAPLRAIQGFTRILLKDYVDKLDDEGKRLGSIIQDNTQKMSQLIDDLLTFSRLGRTAMYLSDINMKEMANAIFHEATTPGQRQRVTFTVDDLPETVGDSSMIRQVWMNLISNALKFSGQREHAVISVIFEKNDKMCIYCVKDNGAGFNMKYKEKLFGVFQRLHSEREFKGTGVGLALVQRIIQRHGGKVWAESEVDKGASFYFSLPLKM